MVELVQQLELEKVALLLKVLGLEKKLDLMMEKKYPLGKDWA